MPRHDAVAGPGGNYPDSNDECRRIFVTDRVCDRAIASLFIDPLQRRVIVDIRVNKRRIM
jgi:hypothetical protein